MSPSHARSALLLVVGAAAVALAAACAYIPEHLDGVPAGPPWTALPLRSWLAEERIEPRALVACADPECPHRIAVGHFRASGAQAEALAATLRDPEALARALRAPRPTPGGKRTVARAPAGKAPVRTAVETHPLREGGLSGFTLALGRADGKGRPAFAAALGRVADDSVEVVLAIGSDEDAVVATARRVAKQNLAR